MAQLFYRVVLTIRLKTAKRHVRNCDSEMKKTNSAITGNQSW